MKNVCPHLSPGIPVLWRNATHVQVGLHPLHSIILDAELATHLLKLCDGRTAIHDIVNTLTAQGVDTEECENALAQLLSHRLMRSLPENDTAHYAPSRLTIWDSVTPHILLQREIASRATPTTQRMDTAIHIHGLGRLGMTVATTLASAGFKHLRVHDNRLITAQDVTTFGASRIDIGNRRDFIALQIIERVQAGVTARNHAMKHRPPHELHVFMPDAVADYPWFDYALGQECMSRDVPHLVATVARQAALITGVIRPGATGCLRCLHLHNVDHDETWPLINAQLIGRTAPDLSPIGLVVQTAMLVVETISRWVDEGTTNDNELISFTWPNYTTGAMINTPHSECGCMWQN